MGRPLSTQQGPKPTVYLASQSPRRQELLTQLVVRSIIIVTL